MKDLNRDPALEQIEHEVVMLLRRADFKKTLDGAENNLFRSGYLILNLLQQTSPLAVRELADHFQLDVSTVSRQIKALENRHLVERRIGEHDGRVNQIFITDAGKRSVVKLKKERLMVYDSLLAGWSEEEKAVFADHLARLNRKIESRHRLH
ncbi:MarR family transcriptional regulator [Sporolactobacillus shoreae]|uniref:MarR family transcriptional regulator n=1 Tax=Sporolactobacillus shoreae TaxID=1465501 RepID=A0A4Z0GLR4_9BACL|nr:MarR family transcriptional regulator [Sporolactobacillus shoreae]TGA97933.1 MarR family transcriptional regulator [Sporolactobacillus shoreae]